MKNIGKNRRGGDKKVDKPFKDILVRKVLPVVLSLSAVFSLVSCAPIDSRSINLDHVPKTQQQIVADSETFGSGQFLWRRTSSNEVKILQHNGDDPIWVDVDESVSEKSVQALEQSFGIWNERMQAINDRYRFEFANSEQLANAETQHDTIVRVESMTEKRWGEAASTATAAVGTIGAEYTIINKIYFGINQKFETKYNIDTLVETFCHEIGHILGLNDVYDTMNAQTSMCIGSFSSNRLMLSPKDFAALVTVYYEEHLDSTAESQSKIDSMNEVLAKFNDDYNKLVIDYLLVPQKIDSSDLETLDNADNLRFDGSKIWYTQSLGIRDGSDYSDVEHSIIVKGDQYQILSKVYSRETGEFVQEIRSSGDVSAFDDYLVLENFPFSTRVADGYPPTGMGFILKIDGEYKLIMEESEGSFVDLETTILAQSIKSNNGQISN